MMCTCNLSETINSALKDANASCNALLRHTNELTEQSGHQEISCFPVIYMILRISLSAKDFTRRPSSSQSSTGPYSRSSKCLLSCSRDRSGLATKPATPGYRTFPASPDRMPRRDT